MKNILSEITEQEKNRILEMHRKSTSRFYLNEQYSSIYSALKMAGEEGKDVLVYIYDESTGGVDQNVINNMVQKAASDKSLMNMDEKPPIVAATSDNKIITAVKTDPIFRSKEKPLTLPAVMLISVSKGGEMNNVVSDMTTKFITTPTNEPTAKN